MAKQKQEEPKKNTVEQKSNIYDLAEKLGIKKEHVEEGLKQDAKKTADAVEKAYAFRFGRK